MPGPQSNLDPAFQPQDRLLRSGSLPPIPRAGRQCPLPASADPLSALEPPKMALRRGALGEAVETAVAKEAATTSASRSKLVRTGRWLKEAYAKHLGASCRSMVCAAFSFGVGTVAAALFQRSFGSDGSSIAATYACGFCAYWGTFLPTLAYGDRAQFRNEGGRLDLKRTLAKVKEYGSLLAFTEGVFGTLRVASMNALVRWAGTSTLQAQVASFVVLNVIYFGILPPVRHALQSYFLRGRKAEDTADAA